jgi:hypothetical protein
LESDAVISKKILQSLATEFNNLVQQKLPTIMSKIRLQTVIFLKQTDTYLSLVNGDLAAHFGLPAAYRQSMVDAIIQKISDSIDSEFKPTKARASGFTGGLELRILVKDFSDILTMVEAMVTTEKGQVLPWLEWLLIKGNKFIISEHVIHLRGGAGRSGGAIMVKNTASAWRVPSQYSGVMTNNWLTRAFTMGQSAYLDIIKNILIQELT